MSQKCPSCPVHIYGVPMDLGQNRRGVDMGPSAIRYSGLHRRLQRIGLEVFDGGNINVPVVEEIREDPPNNSMHHAQAIASVCQDIHKQMAEAIAADANAIFLGGDHSIALGTVSAFIQRAENVGVLWIDAHGDFNIPATSPSGNVHGMVVSSLMGLGPDVLTLGQKRLRADQIVMIGIRDLDTEERRLLRESGINVFTMRDIDAHGIADITREALLALGGTAMLHVSFDLDALDPHVAPGVGTPVPGGLTYREAHLLLEMLADDGRVRSMDLVEVNPILDNGNQTAEIAVEMAASLFGQQIF